MLARYDSLCVGRSHYWIDSTDDLASSIRLGPACLIFDTRPSHTVAEDLLRLHCDILRRHVLHQRVDLRAILSHLSTDIVQMAMQGFNALHLRLVGLVDLRWLVSMSSGSCGMGTVDAWC